MLYWCCLFCGFVIFGRLNMNIHHQQCSANQGNSIIKIFHLKSEIVMVDQERCRTLLKMKISKRSKRELDHIFRSLFPFFPSLWFSLYLHAVIRWFHVWLFILLLSNAEFVLCQYSRKSREYTQKFFVSVSRLKKS